MKRNIQPVLLKWQIMLTTLGVKNKAI